ncbi:MAG TPA: hypothetical protein VJX67_20655 [Blastocatellia bacterium]|nr:hypothetical protein [Blastocatellia bacterium]
MISRGRSVIGLVLGTALLASQVYALSGNAASARQGWRGLASQSGTFASNRFGDAEYFLKVPGQSKARPVRGSLAFDAEAKAIRFFSEEGKQLDVPYGSVTSLVYERTAKPRYALGLLVAWPLLFTKSKKHFLTIQYKAPSGEGQYALIQLDKSNYQSALAAAESQTGVKVQRAEEN